MRYKLGIKLSALNLVHQFLLRLENQMINLYCSLSLLCFSFVLSQVLSFLGVQYVQMLGIKGLNLKSVLVKQERFS